MSGLLVLIHFIFLPAQAFSAEWWELIQLQFEVNSSSLLQRNWNFLSDLFHTFIFLVVIALVSYLLYFWLVTMKKVFVCIMFTIAFVTIMDTFTFYDANQAIIRIIMITILTLILNHYVKRHLEKTVTFDSSEFFLRLITPLMFAMTAISVISYYAPKQVP